MITVTVIEVVILNPGISDHTPLSIQLKEAVKRGPKPFRFLNCLAEHKDFLSVVANAWCRPTSKKHMEDIWWKLKVLKKDLKQINQKEFRNVEKIELYRRKLHDIQTQMGFKNVEEKIELYRQKLHDIQTQMGSHNQPNVLFAEEKELKLESEKWSLVEESILKQKTRNKWLELGDDNIAYFFTSLKLGKLKTGSKVLLMTLVISFNSQKT